MSKLLTKMNVVARLQKVFFIGLFLIASSIFSLYAQTYEECFEIKRLKAQIGATNFEETADSPEDICDSGKEYTLKKKLKIDFYGGVSVNIVGKVTNKIDNIQTTSVTTTPVLPFKGNEEKIKSRKDFKVGVRFSNWRASLNSYNFQFQNTKSNLILAIFDYLHPSGFFIGGGIGNGRIEAKDGTAKGMNTVTNIGFEIKINRQWLIGLGYLSAPLHYKSEFSSCKSGQLQQLVACTGKFDTTFAISSTYIDISYLF